MYVSYFDYSVVKSQCPFLSRSTASNIVLKRHDRCRSKWILEKGLGGVAEKIRYLRAKKKGLRRGMTVL